MLISVKYALDAQNNVGIFSADLNPGDMTIVFKEEKDGVQFQASLINEGGVLFVRIVDPSREARGEQVKIRKAAQVNEVFSIGAATVMIMSIQGGENTGVTPDVKNPDARNGKEISGISDEITDIPNPGGAKMSPISAPPPVIPVPKAASPQVPAPPRPPGVPQTVGLPDPDFQNPAASMQTHSPVVGPTVGPTVGATALKMPIPPPIAAVPAPTPVSAPLPKLEIVPPVIAKAPEVEEISSIEIPDDTSSETFHPLDMSDQVLNTTKRPTEEIPAVVPPAIHAMSADDSAPLELEEISDIGPAVGEETVAGLKIPTPPPMLPDAEPEMLAVDEPETDASPKITAPKITAPKVTAAPEVPAPVVAEPEPELEPDLVMETELEVEEPIPTPVAVAAPIAPKPAAAPTFPLKSPPGAKPAEAKPVEGAKAKVPPAPPIAAAPKTVPPAAKPPNRSKSTAPIPRDEPSENSFSRGMREKMDQHLDPNALPSVDGAKLNYNPEFDHNNNPLPEAKAKPDEAPKVVVPKRLEIPKPRSRAQLLTEDVRDKTHLR